MGLEIIQGPDPVKNGKVRLPRRLYLDADGQIVEVGDKSAAFLLGAEGATITYDRAREVGLIDADGKLIDPAEQPAAEPAKEEAPAKPAPKPRTPAKKKPRTPAKSK
ncbi:MAG: hypothetical protein KGZ65_00085 [Sphingomonadales bacterium]|nr:hypothetical protein [Sphingomonadaceae bacterium]MBS3929604.1 hypothetical protein [Sphingomonadales bacterium]